MCLWKPPRSPFVLLDNPNAGATFERGAPPAVMIPTGGRSRPRLGGILVAVVASTLVVRGGIAFACVPQPLVSLKPYASGPPTSEVTLEAVAVPGSAEVRWNAIDGVVLARATGPNFSVVVTIPNVGEGLYAIIVVGRSENGSVAATGRSSFFVTGTRTAASLPEQPPQSVAVDRSSKRTSPALLLAGGTGLATLGGVVGSFLTSRRRRVGERTTAAADAAQRAQR